MRIIASGTSCAIILGLTIGGLLSLWGPALAQYNPYVVPQSNQSFEDRLYRELQRQQYEIQEQLRQQEQRRQMEQQELEIQRSWDQQNQAERERQRRQMEGQGQPYRYNPYRW